MELSAELLRLQDGFHGLAKDLADRRQGLSVRVFSERDGTFGYCFEDPPDVQLLADDSRGCWPDASQWASTCGLDRWADPCADTYPRDKFCLLAKRGGELLLCVCLSMDVDLRAMDAATRWIWFVWRVSDDSRPYTRAQGCAVPEHSIADIAEASDLAVEWLLQCPSLLKPPIPEGSPEYDEATIETLSKVSAPSRAPKAGEQDQQAAGALGIAKAPEEGTYKPLADHEPTPRLKPSHAKAKALYEWALEHINGAETMTYSELFEKLSDDPLCGGEGLPGNAATFGRYCRAAGVQKNTPVRAKGATRSVWRASEL